MKDYFCIFGGGGIRGVAYVGALRALAENNVNIVGIAGSSIGSVFASLYAVGYSTDEIEDLFLNLKMDIFKDINFNFSKDFSLSKGEKFLSWMRELIESKFYGESYVKGQVKPVRFKDINKDCIILSVNLTDSTFKEFSHFTTPDTEVAFAVRASVSMPGLYKPVYRDCEIFVDGDLIKSWPLWRVSPNLCPDNVRILEFRLEDIQKNKKIENSISYLNAVYNTISGFATDFIMDLYSERDKFDYIKINSTDISVLDFMISSDKKKDLINIGYDTTAGYFKEYLPPKRQKLFENYYQIYLILSRMKIELDNKQGVKEAYHILSELFMYLCEQKRYIDMEIYQKILAFKNFFQKNYKISKFLFLSGYKLSEQSLVLLELDTILSVLEKKISELKS